MTAPLRLAVFDVDGTLIDSQRLILAAMVGAFEGEGLTRPTDAETLAIVGLSLPEAMRALRPSASAPVVAALVEGYRGAIVGLRARLGGEAAAPMYPGARAALDGLAAEAGWVLGIATGKARRGVDHMIGAHGLEGMFATLQTADGHPSKPHPSMLRAALAETGVTARDAVMIGDTTFDMAMARAAGMAAVAVTWGYHPEDSLRAAGADAVIRDFAELPAVLAALGRAEVLA